MFPLFLSLMIAVVPAAPAAPATVTPAQAVSALRTLKALPVPWTYATDGCFARAEVAARALEKAGYSCRKVWCFPSSPDPLYVATPNALKGHCRWSYHVTVALRVRRPNGTTVDTVLDPALSDAPLTVAEWGRKMTPPDGARPYTTLSELGEPPVLPTGLTSRGTGYWPGADPAGGTMTHALATAKRYHAKLVGVRPAAPVLVTLDPVVPAAGGGKLAGVWAASATADASDDHFILFRFADDGTFRMLSVGFKTASADPIDGTFELSNAETKLALTGRGKPVELSVLRLTTDTLRVKHQDGKIVFCKLK